MHIIVFRWIRSWRMPHRPQPPLPHAAPWVALAAAVTWASLGAVGNAHSQTPSAALPAMQTTGALHYACGGIGSDESTAMRAAMKHYPLSLLFARQDGDYLANLAVLIQPQNGTPLRFMASGPVCLLQLPPGPYTVQATTQDGVRQSHSVHVNRNGQTLNFRY